MVNRRELLAGFGLAAGGGAAALLGDHVAENYSLQDPIDVDVRSPLRKNRDDNGRTPVENHKDAEGGDVPSNVDNEDNTHDDQVGDSGTDPWFENYGVDDFTEDLYDESDESVIFTNDFLEDAYDNAGGEIYDADVVGDMLELNGGGGNSEAHMYGENPGLGYSQEFGEKIETLDDEDELTDLLDNYVEDELK